MIFLELGLGCILLGMSLGIMLEEGRWLDKYREGLERILKSQRIKKRGKVRQGLLHLK